MAKSNVRVRATQVGKGVFAQKSFKTGELIGVIRGELVGQADYGSDYCIEFSDEHSLEPKAPFRYLNHSCEPNAELVVYEYEEDDDRDLVVLATRRINEAQEITIDYSWPADAAIKCLCGARKCRGWIVAPSELSELQTRLSEEIDDSCEPAI